MIKIIEAVIASIILISSLTVFFSKTSYNDYSDDLTLVTLKDILSTLISSGELVKIFEQNDATLLKRIITKAYGRPIRFSASFYGTPPEYLSVQYEKPDTLYNILKPTNFFLGKRNIKIYIANKNGNVVVITDNKKADNFKDFVYDGGGLVILDDMETTQLFGKRLTYEYISSNSKLSKDNDISYRISNYFYNISFIAYEGEYDIKNVGNNFIELENGDIRNIGDDYEYNGVLYHIYKTKKDMYALIGSIRRYDNLPLSAGFEESSEFYCIAKNGNKCSVIGGEYGNGRFVWINKYDEKIGNQLLKALIIWASGEKFSIVPMTKKKNTLNKKYFSASLFFFYINPIRLSISVGPLF